MERPKQGHYTHRSILYSDEYSIAQDKYIDQLEAENKKEVEKIDKALKIIKGRFEFTTYENIRKLFLKP